MCVLENVGQGYDIWHESGGNSNVGQGYDIWHVSGGNNNACIFPALLK